MKKSTIITLGVLVLVAILAGAWIFRNNSKNNVNININKSEPTPVASTGNAAEKKDLIVVDTPQPNSVLASTFEVKGKARGPWFFEASFPIVLKADDGTVLLESYIMTDSNSMTEDFVPFSKTFSFGNPKKATSGTLILKKDNPSGLPQNEDSLVIPVRFASEETMSVNVYFNKPITGAESCDAVQTPVTRTVPKTEGVAKAAILELLKGPSSSTTPVGLTTAIPTGTALNKLAIRNGTAYADFNAKLDPHGGSCHIEAIRAQIEDTLKQFSTVKNVVISIDGESDLILQP